MVKNLDDRWARLRHAYGDASDTPGYLRALEGGDVGESDSALRELWSSLCHQGTVYSASAAAVPLLLDILDRGTAPNLAQIGWLVGHIGHGTGYVMVHGKLRSHQPRSDDAQRLDEEHLVVDACRAAARRGFPVWLKLLNSEDRDLRGCAVYAMSRFGDDEEVSRALAARAEVEEDKRLGIGLALAQTFGASLPPRVGQACEAVFEQLMELSRAGRIPERFVFQTLDILLTEDLEEGRRFASEAGSDPDER